MLLEGPMAPEWDIVLNITRVYIVLEQDVWECVLSAHGVCVTGSG